MPKFVVLPTNDSQSEVLEEVRDLYNTQKFTALKSQLKC